MLRQAVSTLSHFIPSTPTVCLNNPDHSEKKQKFMHHHHQPCPLCLLLWNKIDCRAQLIFLMRKQQKKEAYAVNGHRCYLLLLGANDDAAAFYRATDNGFKNRWSHCLWSILMKQGQSCDMDGWGWQFCCKCCVWMSRTCFFFLAKCHLTMHITQYHLGLTTVSHFRSILLISVPLKQWLSLMWD